MSVSNAVKFKAELLATYLSAQFPFLDVSRIRNCEVYMRFDEPYLGFTAFMDESWLDLEFDEIPFTIDCSEQDVYNKVILNGSGIVLDDQIKNNPNINANFFQSLAFLNDVNKLDEIVTTGTIYLSPSSIKSNIYGYTIKELTQFINNLHKIHEIAAKNKLTFTHTGAAFNWSLCKGMYSCIDPDHNIWYVFEPKNRNLKLAPIGFKIGNFADLISNKDGMFEKSLEIVKEMKCLNKYVQDEYNKVAKIAQTNVETKTKELVNSLRAKGH